MQPHHAGQIYDPAIALLYHLSGHGFHAQEGALQIGLHHLIKVALLHGEHQSVPGDSGVVYQNIDAAKALNGGFHQFLHLGAVRHIAAQIVHLCPQSAAGLGRLLGGGLISGETEYKVGSAGGQLQADCPAQSPAAAGDNGGFSF